MNNKFIHSTFFFWIHRKKINLHTSLNCISFIMHFDIIKENLQSFTENLRAVGNLIRNSQNLRMFMFSIRVVETCQIYGYIQIIYPYVYKRGYMSVEKVYLQKYFDRQIRGRHTVIISHSLFDGRTSMYSSSSFLNLQYCAKILRGPRTIDQYR